MYILNDETGIPHKELYKQLLKVVKRQKGGIKSLFKTKITLEEAQQVEYVFLNEINNLDLEFLKFFKNLKTLSISRCQVLPHLNGLRHVPNLEDFYACDTNILDFSMVTQCRNLEMFDYMIIVQESYKKDNFNFLRSMDQLLEVDLTNNLVEDVSFLSENKCLKELVLAGNAITHLESLKDLPMLGFLEIDGCALTELAGVTEMKNLKYLYAEDNLLSEAQKNEYREKLSHLETVTL